MNLYGKYYESRGAGKCRYWFHLSMGMLKNKNVFKPPLFGYWNVYNDGFFHFFSVWPFVIRWHKSPITQQEYEEDFKPQKNELQK